MAKFMLSKSSNAVLPRRTSFYMSSAFVINLSKFFFYLFPCTYNIPGKRSYDFLGSHTLSVILLLVLQRIYCILITVGQILNYYCCSQKKINVL